MLVVLLVGACHSPSVAPITQAVTPASPAPPAEASGAHEAAETLAADTPRATIEGTTFVAPKGWTIRVRGAAVLLEAPEPGSRIALVDVRAKDPDTAVALAWAASTLGTPPPLELATAVPDDEGWVDTRRYAYTVPTREQRDVVAIARHHGEAWSVSISDLADAVAEKRNSQLKTILGRLQPKGYRRETFAGKAAHKLDAARLAALTAFVDQSRDKLGIPGIALGIVQDSKIVFADGFGRRELDNPRKPDADTRFMIASNTKALTTLLLATLVDDHKLTWDTPVAELMPSFKLGDAATTASVRVKHLVCACTGMPRRDYELLMESATPASVMASLAKMQPTSAFGELFQYSNQLVAAGGYLAAAVLSPNQELGAAYDAAMQARVFAPLGMTSTTFDFARALDGNHAGAYELDLDGKPGPAVMAVNYLSLADRPDGGAWSTVRDMLKYVAMELARGKLPGGRRYVSEAALLARRAPQVAMSQDESYGLGLMVDRTWGIPVIHHGGDLIGYHSDMIWLPDHDVGAVILTNGRGGVPLRRAFRRKLLEVLFDGQPLADAQLAGAASRMFEEIGNDRRRLTLPAAEADAGELAARYHNDALGDLAVRRDHGATIFDFGEWQSAVASFRDTDGTTSFVTAVTGMRGLQFVVGFSGAKRTLILNDGQHEYTFTEN